MDENMNVVDVNENEVSEIPMEDFCPDTVSESKSKGFGIKLLIGAAAIGFAAYKLIQKKRGKKTNDCEPERRMDDDFLEEVSDEAIIDGEATDMVDEPNEESEN